MRGAAGLGLAVLVAKLTGVQHSFWVVLGTLSVLRSNALNTRPKYVLRGLLGTTAGFIVGAAIVALMEQHERLLWLLLPPAVLFAGLAGAGGHLVRRGSGRIHADAVDPVQHPPAGWRVGRARIEDIALGVGVSLVVGVLFWPRGAAPALRRALAEAYTDGARYLASTVRSGMSRAATRARPGFPLWPATCWRCRPVRCGIAPAR